MQEEQTGALHAGAGETNRQCEDFSVERRSFIVVDALLKARLAEQRMEALSNAGIGGMLTVPTDCLNSWPAPGRIALYTGIIYPNRPAAVAAAKEHNRRLKENDLGVVYGRPVKVRPILQ